jgi:signal peptidase
VPAEKARRNARVLSRKRVLAAALACIFLGLIATAATAVFSGQYQLHPVLSGSMRPGLPIGGVVVTKRVPTSSLLIRDVIVFHRPDHPDELVVHRIIAMKPGPAGPIVQTQGDANDAPDPWRATMSGSTAYRADFSLPLLGYPAVWMHSPDGRRVLITVGLLLVAGAAIRRPSRFRRHAPEMEEQPSVVDLTVAAVAAPSDSHMAASE